MVLEIDKVVKVIPGISIIEFLSVKYCIYRCELLSVTSFLFLGTFQTSSFAKWVIIKKHLADFNDLIVVESNHVLRLVAHEYMLTFRLLL